jgi:preprotein translocase subunit SecG
MGLIITLLYIIFVLSAITLTVVILLQEGKGGGFGGALGTAGQQAFGVATKGIQTFTGVTALVFLISALSIHVLNRYKAGTSVVDGAPVDEAPFDPSGSGK